MLSVKGLDSNKLIDENNLKYLVFSVTNTKYNLNTNKVGQPNHPINEKDIFFSISLILMTSEIRGDIENKK